MADTRLPERESIVRRRRTMGVGAALMEELVVDKRIGFFVNHDLALYAVPVHADVPHQEVIFLDSWGPFLDGYYRL